MYGTSEHLTDRLVAGNGVRDQSNDEIRVSPVARAYQVCTDTDDEAIVFATSYAEAIQKVRDHYDVKDDEIAGIHVLDGDAIQ